MSQPDHARGGWIPAPGPMRVAARGCQYLLPLDMLRGGKIPQRIADMIGGQLRDEEDE